MTREELKEFLPHREPMLLVDEIDIDENKVAHSKYTIRSDEYFLKGHFPGAPVVPGVILCEIMAQSCALLMKDDLPGHLTFYTGINNVRFKSSVFPGDTVEVEAVLSSKRLNLYFCEAKLRVKGRLCASGSLSFALTKDTRTKENNHQHINNLKDLIKNRKNNFVMSGDCLNEPIESRETDKKSGPTIIGSDEESIKELLKELMTKQILT